MNGSSNKARTWSTLAAFVAAGLMGGLWLYLSQADIVENMRKSEDQLAFQALAGLRQHLNGALDRTWDRERIAGRAVTVDTKGQGLFREPDSPSPKAIAPTPSDPLTVFLFTLESQNKFADALAALSTSQLPMHPDLLFLKARCLFGIGQRNQARELLQIARKDANYSMVGPLSFSLLTILLELKMATGPERDALLGAIATFDIPLTTRDALTLQSLLPLESQKFMSTFVSQAKLCQSLAQSPLKPNIREGVWLTHDLGAIRRRGQKIDLLDTQVVEREALKIAQEEVSNDFILTLDGESSEGIVGQISPSHLLVSLQAKNQKTSHLVENLNRALPILASLLAFLGVWIYLKDLRREIEVTKLKSNFIDVVSHELRTPLTILAVKTEMLAGKSVPPEKITDYAHDAHVEVGKLSRLMDRLLEFKRLEDGSLPLQLEEIELRQLIGEVKEEMILLDEAKNRTIVIDENILSGTVFADREIVVSVLRNLVENALKYAPCGHVQLGWESKGPFIRLWVADRGPGVSSTESTQIFDRFNRGAAAADGAKRGVGLGLAFVHLAAQAHKGRCGVESRRNGGSLFYLELPRS